MLTKAMRKYVESKGVGYTKETQSVYNARVRTDIRDAIKDLTLTLNNLPEKQLEQEFNAATLKPFFKSLFHLSETNHKRILGLWYLLLAGIANTEHVQRLVGYEKWRILALGKSTDLQALYSVAMFEG